MCVRVSWAQEAYYVNEIENYQDIYDDIQTGMDICMRLSLLSLRVYVCVFTFVCADEFKLGMFWTDIACLIAVGVGLRVIAYFALEFLHRDKRK